jgi:hypothetical protein
MKLATLKPFRENPEARHLALIFAELNGFAVGFGLEEPRADLWVRRVSNQVPSRLVAELGPVKGL